MKSGEFKMKTIKELLKKLFGKSTKKSTPLNYAAIELEMAEDIRREEEEIQKDIEEMDRIIAENEAYLANITENDGYDTYPEEDEMDDEDPIDIARYSLEKNVGGGVVTYDSHNALDVVAYIYDNVDNNTFFSLSVYNMIASFIANTSDELVVLRVAGHIDEFLSDIKGMVDPDYGRLLHRTPYYHWALDSEDRLFVRTTMESLADYIVEEDSIDGARIRMYELLDLLNLNS